MRAVSAKLVLVLLLVVAGSLAGCSGKKNTPTDSGLPDPSVDVRATSTTGVIKGVVVDAAVHPVANVLLSVNVQGKPPMKTNSSRDGGFGFSGLAPGTYFVAAKKAGYAPMQVSVEVQAGIDNPKTVKIQLVPDPASAPYFAVYKFDGYIECSVTLVALRYAACSTVDNTTKDNFLVSYTLDQPPQWIQSEMVWVATQAGGEQMQISITDFSTPTQERVNASEGPSPQVITVNETTAAARHFGVNNTVVIRVFNSENPNTDTHSFSTVQQQYAGTVYPAYNSTTPQQGKDEYNSTMGTACRPDCAGPLDRPDCIPYPTLFNACLNAGGVGATVEQPFTIYTHVFYHYQPPHGWQFSKDGDYSPPA